MVSLAVRCNKCGMWGAKTTINIKTATFKCKYCKNPPKKLRIVKGWNLQIKLPKKDQTMPELVQWLNMCNKRGQSKNDN